MSALNVVGPVFLVGSSERTDTRDCMVYLIQGDDGKGALIDAGAGPSWKQILENVGSTGMEPLLWWPFIRPVGDDFARSC